MRVKEGGSNDSEMGKKKKNKKTPEHHNTSDEETKRGCSHKETSFTFQGVKKGLKNTSFPLGTCTSCQSPTKKTSSAAEEDASDSPFEPTVWICLQCGHQGCDRQSRDRHAVLHYETPRSQSHALALSLHTWQVWCYKCDDEVPSGDWKKLTECSDWLKKQMGVSKSERSHGSSSRKKGKDRDGEKDEGGKNKTVVASGEKNSSKVKGLVNLGNTCFFNAVMQNLTQTHVLRSMLGEKWSPGKMVEIPLDTNLDFGQSNEDKDEDTQEENSLNLTVTLPSMGTLTSALLSFLEDMNKDSKNSSVNPRPLFSEVCQKAARFKGYQQQDSHELLRYLLDSMKSEQIKRMQEGILLTYNIKDKDKAKVNKLDENTKKRIRELGLKSRLTFVDGVFGGYLNSSVKCQVCNTISEISEPFLDLSLPILEAKGSKKGFPAAKNPDRPQTLAEQAKLAEPESDDLPSPGATATPKLSKYKQEKAREQARKLSRKKKRRSGSYSQGSPKTLDVKDCAGSNSENEEGPDPNDADSEASMMDRRLTNEDAVGTSMGVATEAPSANLDKASTPEGAEADVQGDDAKLKGGSNLDPLPPVIDTGTGCTALNGDAVGRLNGNVEDKVNAIERVVNGLSLLDLNSTPDGDSMDGEKPQENGCLVGDDLTLLNNQVIAPENRTTSGDFDKDNLVNSDDKKVDQNQSVSGGIERTELDVQPAEEDSHQTRDGKTAEGKDDSKEDGDSTPTNEPSSPLKKGKRPPPLMPAPSAPPVISRSSPPNSPLSPSIRAKATSPLGPRYNAKSQECSVQSCLSQFTSPEWLTGPNKFGCEHCTAKKGKDADGKSKTQYTDASKQLLIQHPPPILTLHLKRFQQVGFSLRKITRHIDFPLVLDLSPFCSESCQKFANKDGQVLYALYGIVEHSGRLQFGHYTSYIKVRPPSQPLYQHTLGIPRSLNLLRAAAALTKKSHGAGAEKRRHPSKNSSSSASGEHPQPNGILPSATTDGDLSTATHNSTNHGSPLSNTTANHNGYIPSEKGGGAAGQFPLASSGKDSAPAGKWYYVSDTHVSEAPESKVLNAQAYLLFYERIL